MFIGIDGGGTSCKAILQNENGHTISQGIGGPANPVNGVSQSQNSILEACFQALDNAGLSRECVGEITVGAGLAGLHLGAMQQVMMNWAHPFKSLALTTDLHAAVLGAHLGHDGGVLILGTGFSALAVCGQQRLAIGGMGFPINANGSGSWLGLEAVKAVLLAEDQLAPQTILQNLLLAGENKTVLAQHTVNANATTFGQYAPAVFEAASQNDEVAQNLLRQATQFAESVIEKLTDFGAPRVTLIGSVANALLPLMSAETQLTIHAAKASPQEGAIMFARQAAQQ